MRLLVDTNVLMDVLMERHPFFADSLGLVNSIFRHQHVGVIAVHTVTTVYYLVEKEFGAARALNSIDWLLAHFAISDADRQVLVRAREISIPDFEDAVVVASAERGRCDAIISRDDSSFSQSRIPAYDPKTFLAQYGTAL